MNLDKLLAPIFIEGLQKILAWYKSDEPHYLRSIFNLVGFIDRNGSEPKYYVPPSSLSPNLTYPQTESFKDFNKIKVDTLAEIARNYKGFSQSYLKGLNGNQLFFLLERYGSNIPVNKEDQISIFDAYKIKAAKAVINQNRQEKNLAGNLLINIDLSGIQKFIYNIVSTGALKNLRSRSFFIELMCYHIIDQVLQKFNLHQANVLMNGGGSIYIIGSQPNDYQQILDDIDYRINKFLLEEFNGRLHAAFAYVKCTDEEIEQDIKKVINDLSREIFKKKQRKFGILIERGEFEFVDKLDPTFFQCEICHKDEKYGDPEHKLVLVEGSEDRYRCKFCDQLIDLGNDIPDVKFIYEIGEAEQAEVLKIENSNYLLSKNGINGKQPKWIVFDDCHDLVDKITATAVPIYVRTYTRKNQDLPEYVQKELEIERKRLNELIEQAKDKKQKTLLNEEKNSLKPKHIATMEYVAEAAEGAKYIAALRMDADNMGKILHEGFYEKESLEKLSAFSRNVNNFFKLHLESLCKNGSHSSNQQQANARNVQVIYAGGDDLFILGAWSDTMELAIDIGNAFKDYTGNNIDMGLSGGLTVHHANFPVSKMAILSLNALQTAKTNFDPCWECRKDWYDCPLFKDGFCYRKDSLAPFYTEFDAYRKKQSDEKLKIKYSTEHSRLQMALKWKNYDQKNKIVIDEVKDFIQLPLNLFKQHEKARLSREFFHRILILLDTWYDEGFLYLPKVVWAIDKFKDRLKREIDAETKMPLYNLYDKYLHFMDYKRLATLHISLYWTILLMRKGEKTNEN
jgi:CRISPR-associated protein Csm1